MHYDAVLLVSFGGPETRDDVLPFLENVLRGRNVPRDRMLEVAEHYYHFGGKSPINDQNRLLIAGLRELLQREGPDLPVYWGNRNWAPFLTDTVREMKQGGVKNALAFVTSAYSSYSGCRQYRENIEQAREQCGDGAPRIDKLRVFFNHPGFIDPMIENVSAAVRSLPPGSEPAVIFTAHSIPLSMAATSCYRQQIEEASRLVASACGLRDWSVAWQSRSGPPSQPWLEPDVCEVIRKTSAGSVVLVPIGFISDHMEVLFDLDEEACSVCAELGIPMVRAKTVGAHPQFLRMIRELVLERMNSNTAKRAIGNFAPNHDVCPVQCCPAPAARPAPADISLIRPSP